MVGTTAPCPHAPAHFPPPLVTRPVACVISVNASVVDPFDAVVDMGVLSSVSVKDSGRSAAARHVAFAAAVESHHHQLSRKARTEAVAFAASSKKTWDVS